MNTPRKKKRTRWTQKPHHIMNDGGGVSWGISVAEVAQAYGHVLSYWWHVEEQFLYVLDDLITGTKAASYGVELGARNIFRTLVSQKSRIEIMKALLENMPHNANKPEIYDEIIEEFANLNAIRNLYVHGTWQTKSDTMEVYLKPSRSEHEVLEIPKRVTAEDLYDTLRRMQALFTKIAMRDAAP